MSSSEPFLRLKNVRVSGYMGDRKAKSHVFFSHKHKNISGILSLESLEFSRDSFHKLNIEYNFLGKFIKANHN